jgi:hypothetical protein
MLSKAARTTTRRCAIAGLVAGALLAVGAGPASAAIVFNGAPGTGAPPTTLGPYSMTPFANDTRANAGDVSDTPTPLGNVTYDNPMRHVEVGAGWATWSHGYTGDVYYSKPHPSPLTRTMTMPAGTGAIYFYVEGDNGGTFNFTATSNDNTSSGPVSVTSSSGAKYFGFYATPGETIASISVTGTTGVGGFGVGEFGTAQKLPPAPVSQPAAPFSPSTTNVADTVKPFLGALGFSSSTFKAAPSGGSIAAKRKSRAKVGTKVSFSLSEASAVKFTVERKTSGRRVAGKCKAKSRRNAAKPKCTRWKKVRGSFTVAGRAGQNSFTFRGRIGGKALKPGKYRLNSQATDKAKNASPVKRKAFSIVE